MEKIIIEFTRFPLGINIDGVIVLLEITGALV